jgi:DNA (cytosine-5)-methyltransferase 1
VAKEFTSGALFAGIGGFCIGFEKHGVKTKWAIENDPSAVSIYKQNIKNVRVIDEDVRKVKVSEFGLEPVDILHAGFPCQSFSQAGERKGFDDPRGMLFFEIVRLVFCHISNVG